MASNPLFDAAIESVHNIAAQWEPVNADGAAAAQAVLNMIDDTAELSEAIADATRQLAEKSQESVYFNSGAAGFLAELSQHFQAPVEAMKEATAGVRSSHADDFERLEDTDETRDAWDRTRNRDV